MCYDTLRVKVGEVKCYVKLLKTNLLKVNNKKDQFLQLLLIIIIIMVEHY